MTHRRSCHPVWWGNSLFPLTTQTFFRVPLIPPGHAHDTQCCHVTHYTADYDTSKIVPSSRCHPVLARGSRLYNSYRHFTHYNADDTILNLVSPPRGQPGWARRNGLVYQTTGVSSCPHPLPLSHMLAPGIVTLPTITLNRRSRSVSALTPLHSHTMTVDLHRRMIG